MAAEFQDIEERNALEEEIQTYYEPTNELSDSHERQRPRKPLDRTERKQTSVHTRRVSGPRLPTGLIQSQPFGVPQRPKHPISNARLRSSSKFKPVLLADAPLSKQPPLLPPPHTANDLLPSEEAVHTLSAPNTRHLNPVKGLHSSHDRVHILSLQSSTSLSTALAVALVGTVAFGVLLVLWLQRVFFAGKQSSSPAAKLKLGSAQSSAATPATKNLIVLRRNSKVGVQTQLEPPPAMDVDEGKASLDSPAYYTPIGDVDRTENQFVFCPDEKRPTLQKSASVTEPTPVARGRRFSLYERRADHHSPPVRRLTKLQIEDAVPTSPIAAPSPTPSSASNTSISSTSTVVSNRNRSANAKLSHVSHSADKENAIPYGGELYSPKMKLSEQALAQQNSPRVFDSPPASGTRFSFSPVTTAVPTCVTTTTTLNASPLLSSAVYRHGNYFKFPEVDANVVEPKPEPKLSAQTRRARLKSISLDSDGARMVEDSLEEDDDQPVYNPKNKNHLTISITADESSPPRTKNGTPKTPTFSQSKQKAISLDSSDAPAAAKPKCASASVPTSPKKAAQPKAAAEEDAAKPAAVRSEHLLGSNLQNPKNLSLSNNNLKTLPEVMTLSDFSVESDDYQPACSRTARNSILQRRGSNHSLVLNINGSFGNLSKSLSISNYSLGSNSSCTLNNQTSAAAPAAEAVATNRKRNLLQRRGSNTSLTLNIRGSSSMNLNHYASHSSLNFSQPSVQPKVHASAPAPPRKGLLERRNSNTSLTLSLQNQALSISNVSLNTNAADFEPLALQPLLEQPTRKFLSSENLNSQCSKLNQAHVRNSIRTCFGSVSDLKPYREVDEPDAESPPLLEPPSQGMSAAKRTFRSLNISRFDFSSTGALAEEGGTFKQPDMCSCTGVRNITTRPLSPQTTSEDFKMYLANIQLLQNASNVLSADDLRTLQRVFEKSYNGAFDEPKDDEEKAMVRQLHQEFWDLPTNYQEKPLVFGSQAKNRYKSILPNEHSRVLLDYELGSLEEPYINANYIKGPDYTTNSYIATQGPMANTMHEFWLMVYQNISRHRRSAPPEMQAAEQKIIMLTNFTENNRQKCAVYFPTRLNDTLVVSNTNEPVGCDGELAAYYDRYLAYENETDPAAAVDLEHPSLAAIPKTSYFVIRNVDIRSQQGYKVRRFACLYCPGGGGRAYRFACSHYWYPDWPDHRSPSDINVLLDICLHAQLPTEGQQRPLPIIHCSAGIGRTGCFAAILNGMRQIHPTSQSVLRSYNLVFKDAERERERDKDWKVDILGIVCNLRLQRGGMVQNSEQYELIHRALCLYWDRLQLQLHG